MKKSSLTLVLLAILPLGVSQCSSAYRLVDYKEFCGMDDLDTHATVLQRQVVVLKNK